MIQVIEDIRINLSIQEVIKLLYKEGKQKKNPSPEYLTEINNCIREAMNDIEIKAVYGIFSSDNLLPRYIFSHSEKTIFAVCTISNKLEKKVTQLLKENELAKGVIFDAIASHAAEAAAEEVNNRILLDNHILLEGKSHTTRFSPGYCTWDLTEGQKLIFNLLPNEKIGVQLNPSMLMIPRKSISFAINIGNEIDDLLGKRECNSCELLNCKFRR